MNTIANHNNIYSLNVELQRLSITEMHADITYLKIWIKWGGSLLNWIPAWELESGAVCMCTVYSMCARVIKAQRENTRKWPNISTVGGLQLVPYEWGLWLRSEESRSVPVPMLPYQYCREKKESRKEWIVIGPAQIHQIRPNIGSVCGVGWQRNSPSIK